MADTTTNSDIILNVQVNDSQAVKGIVEWKRVIREAKEEQTELKKQLDQGVISQQKFDEEMTKSTAIIKNAQSATRVLEKEIQNNIKAQTELEGSINKVTAELDLNVRAYNKMSEAQRNSDAGQTLSQSIADQREQLKGLREELGDHRLSVGDYEKANRSLKTELRDLTYQLAELKAQGEDNTQEYQNMLAEAANLRDAIGDVNVEINNMASDTAPLDSILGAFEALTASVGLYEAATGAANESDQALAETIKKMQIIMTALTSLQTLQNSLQKESNLMQGVAIIQIRAKTAAEALATKGTIAATIAQKALNVVANANPYVLLATALLTVVGALYAYSLATKTTSKEVEKHNKLVEKSIENYAEQVTELENLIRIGTKETSTLQEKQKVLKTLNEKYLDSNNQLKSIKDLETWLVEKAPLVIKAYESKARAAAAYSMAVELNKQKLQEERKTTEDFISWSDKAVIGLTKALDPFKLSPLQNMATDWANASAEIEKTNALSFLADDINYYLDESQKGMAEYEKFAKESGLKIEDEAKKTGNNLVKTAKEAAERINKLTVEIMKEGREKELAELRLSQQKELSEVVGNTVEKAKQVSLINEKYRLQEAALNKKYSDEELKNLQEKEQKRIELLISSTKEGSEEAHKLRLQQIEKERQAEIDSNNKLTEAYRQNEILINAKYDKMASDERTKRNEEVATKSLEAFRLEWSNRVLATKEGSEEELNTRLQTMQTEYDYIQSNRASLFASEQEYTNATLELKRSIADAEDAILQKQLQNQEKLFASFDAVFGGFEELFTTLAEDSETMGAFSKAMAAFNIGISSAEAIAKATASAKGVTAIDYIAQVAAAVGTVLANIARAKKLLSSEKEPSAPKFATGGGPIIRGSGGPKSDKIKILASPGESIMTAKTTTMFPGILSVLNVAGGGVPLSTANNNNASLTLDNESIAKIGAVVLNGVKNVRSVVSVQDINTAIANVDVIDSDMGLISGN